MYEPTYDDRLASMPQRRPGWLRGTGIIDVSSQDDSLDDSSFYEYDDDSSYEYDDDSDEDPNFCGCASLGPASNADAPSVQSASVHRSDPSGVERHA